MKLNIFLLLCLFFAACDTAENLTQSSQHENEGITNSSISESTDTESTIAPHNITIKKEPENTILLKALYGESDALINKTNGKNIQLNNEISAYDDLLEKLNDGAMPEELEDSIEMSEMKIAVLSKEYETLRNKAIAVGKNISGIQELEKTESGILSDAPPVTEAAQTDPSSLTIKSASLKSNTIAADKYKDKRRITSVSFEGQIFAIGNGAFQNTQIKTLDLSNVRAIGTQSFKGVSTLTDLTIGDQISLISQGAFQNTGLTVIDMPAQVNRIVSNAFAGTNPIVVVLRGDTIAIADDAFTGCSHIDEVYLSTTLYDSMSKEKLATLFGKDTEYYEVEDFSGDDDNADYETHPEKTDAYRTGFQGRNEICSRNS